MSRHIGRIAISLEVLKGLLLLPSDAKLIVPDNPLAQGLELVVDHPSIPEVPEGISELDQIPPVDASYAAQSPDGFNFRAVFRGFCRPGSGEPFPYTPVLEAVPVTTNQEA